jgi:hypothetical protein
MSAQRHFTMSTLSATIAIRQYLHNHTGVSSEDAATSLQRLDCDIAANDFASGLEVNALIPDHLTFANPVTDLMAALASLIAHHRPFWMRGFPYGRSRVSEMLSIDEAQCFRAAGLFNEPPTATVREWWDNIAQEVRANLEDTLLEQGRVAEEYSYEYERMRLVSLGILRAPIWVAVNNNGAGFDILSYDPGPIEPLNRLIEVKSSSQNPPRMILTRGEWEAAINYGAAYVFHLWKLPKKELLECKVADVAPHIPIDRGSGIWGNVEIPFDSISGARPANIVT